MRAGRGSIRGRMTDIEGHAVVVGDLNAAQRVDERVTSPRRDKSPSERSLKSLLEQAAGSRLIAFGLEPQGEGVPYPSCAPLSGPDPLGGNLYLSRGVPGALQEHPKITGVGLRGRPK
jgi:hypothetical protein